MMMTIVQFMFDVLEITKPDNAHFKLLLG